MLRFIETLIPSESVFNILHKFTELSLLDRFYFYHHFLDKKTLSQKLEPVWDHIASK